MTISNAVIRIRFKEHGNLFVYLTRLVPRFLEVLENELLY